MFRPIFGFAGLRSSVQRGRKLSSVEGALHFEATFTRIFTSESSSSLVLKDLISAHHLWVYGDDSVEQVNILSRTVRDEKLTHGAGNLIVDVRCSAITDYKILPTSAKSDQEHQSVPTNYLIEVQHRKERDFPYRAFQYGCAEVANQYAEERFQPVHILGFCDYDFAFNGSSNRLSTLSTNWREKGTQGELKKCITTLCLQPMNAVLARLPGGVGNTAIHDTLARKFVVSLVMLPHVPLLRDLRVNTHPLIRWASIIAHATPHNGAEVPKEVRDNTPAVEAVLGMLNDTARLAEVEAREEAERQHMERSIREEGREEGGREMLATLGIRDKADFEGMFPGRPVPTWLE